MPYKIEREMLSDEQVKTLGKMLKEYRKMKNPNSFIQSRIKDISVALAPREDAISSRIYKTDQE